MTSIFNNFILTHVILKLFYQFLTQPTMFLFFFLLFFKNEFYLLSPCGGGDILHGHVDTHLVSKMYHEPMIISDRN